MSGTLAAGSGISVSGTITVSSSTGGIANTYTSSGSIGEKEGIVILNSTAGIAMTLAAPTSGTDDGKILRIVDITPYSTSTDPNTVTTSNDSYGDGGSGQNMWNGLTFGAGMGESFVSFQVILLAYQGHWWLLGGSNAAKSYS